MDSIGWTKSWRGWRERGITTGQHKMILHFCPECQHPMFYQTSDIILPVGWFCADCDVFIEDDDYY